jgi:hypothetical protein
VRAREGLRGRKHALAGSAMGRLEVMEAAKAARQHHKRAVSNAANLSAIQCL